jgi:solute:Na+ symporter, SSS family
MKFNLNRVAVFLSFVFIAACDRTPNKKQVITDSLKQQAIAQLQLNLRTQPKLVKAHAAEFLLWLGLDKDGEVHRIFIEEDHRYSSESPYRIPLWRVLAQTENDPEKKKVWVDKIIGVWLDTLAPDRVSAAESLSKLKISLSERYPALTKEILDGEKNPLSMYTLWSASTGLTDSGAIRKNRSMMVELIDTTKNDHVRALGAYTLRHLRGIRPDEWHRLAHRALLKNIEPKFEIYLLSAAFVLAPDDSLSSSLYGQIRNELLKARHSTRKDDRMEMAAALANSGVLGDIPVLVSLLNNEDPVIIEGNTDRNTAINHPDNADVRSVAAYAILKIDRRYALTL